LFVMGLAFARFLKASKQPRRPQTRGIASFGGSQPRYFQPNEHRDRESGSVYTSDRERPAGSMPGQAPYRDPTTGTSGSGAPPWRDAGTFPKAPLEDPEPTWK
jgi:hypothetical protein